MANKLVYEEVIFDSGQVTRRKGIFHTIINDDKWLERLKQSLNQTHSLNYELEDWGEDYMKWSERYGGPTIELEPLIKPTAEDCWDGDDSHSE